MATKLKRVPLPAQERRKALQRHLDNLSRVPPETSTTKGYAWILRHVDGWYVDRLVSKGRYFGYVSIQKMAIRFPSRREALDALTKRDANMRILGDNLFDTPARPLRRAHYQVRVVRLKLKEKVWACRWVLKCGDTKRPCYVSDIDPDDGLFAEYSSQRTAKMFMTKQDAVDALKRRNAHPHWNNPAHPLRRPPYQVRVVRLKLKEKA